MKLNEIQKSDLDIYHDFIVELKKYFYIYEDRFGDSTVGKDTVVTLQGDLVVRPEIKFDKMPIFIGRLLGTLDLRGSGIKSLDNLPGWATSIVIGGSEINGLFSSHPIGGDQLKIEDCSNLADLTNSGNLFFKTITLIDCVNFASLNGIKSLHGPKGTGRVEIIDAVSFAEDVTKWPDTLIVAFGHPPPPSMPLTNLIAYYHVTGYPVVDPNAISIYLNRHDLMKYAGKGAHAIPALARYFKSIGEPWRISSL